MLKRGVKKVKSSRCLDTKKESTTNKTPSSLPTKKTWNIIFYRFFVSLPYEFPISPITALNEEKYCRKFLYFYCHFRVKLEAYEVLLPVEKATCSR